MKKMQTSVRTAMAARPLRGRLAAIAFGVALACGAVDHSSAQELMLPQSLSDLVAESDFIAIADVVSAQPRRNSRGNLIVTDYRFRVSETLEGAAPGSEFVLTQGGGTLAGETHQLSDAAELNVGQRYLIFVRPGRGEVFSPFVGGAQGVYLLTQSGATPLSEHRRVVDRDALLDEVRGLVSERGAAPARVPAAPAVVPGRYPAKAYLPVALTPPGSADARAPYAASVADGPAAPAGAATSSMSSEPGTDNSGPGVDYYYEHRIAPPAVINGFPHDWTPWYPEDEYQMSNWNQYGGDVFHVYTDPTGNWAWENDRFDLAGWPSNDDMISQFGEGWGATTLGITYSRWFGDGPIVEADTALNPAYCWTLNERQGLTHDDACWGFRQTMTHELGHSWGLQHPWETQAVWWDSIMNYSPKEFRNAELFADDTNAVRVAFGGPAIHDALLSLYTTAGGGSQGSIYTPTQPYPLSLRHGDDLASWIPNQFKIENLGTDDIVSPNVQFWLTQQRMDWNAGYVYLGAGSYVSVPVFSTYTYWLPSLPIAYGTPTGNYWFAAYIPDADGNMNNNSAWADERYTVHVDNNPTTLVPEEYWQTSETGYLGPAGVWTFSFWGDVGGTYYLSMCPGTGGSATFDTTMSVSYGGSELAFDDDTCDYQSQITFVAPYSGTFTVTVGSYNNEYQGSFAIGYRRDSLIADPIYYGGFDP
ncbi:MAG: hypothetical protein ABW186_12005 [Rhodanobacteraceae bacterium]